MIETIQVCECWGIITNEARFCMFSIFYEMVVLYNYWICFRAKDQRTNNIEDAIWQDDEDLFEGSAYEIPGENDDPRFYK